MKKAKPLTKNTIAKYAIYLLLMLTLCYARTSGGVAPFGLGLLVGLIYCKQNLPTIALMYILGMLLSAPSLTTLPIAIAPPIILASADILHRLTKRTMKMWQINIYALLSQIPLLVFGFFDLAGIITNIATVILSQIFTYTTTSFLYAAIIRGIKYRFRLDEIMSGLILLSGAAMGLFRIDIFGFRIFYLFATIIIALTSTIARPYSALAVSAMLGLGAAVMTGNLMIVGGLVVIALLTLGFIKHNYYLGLAALAIADIFVGMYFNAFGGYGLLHFIAMMIGLILCLFIPKSLRDKLNSIYQGYTSTASGRNIIEVNRKEVRSRLLHVSKVFTEMGELLLGEKRQPLEAKSVATKLAGEISTTYCSQCPNLTSCMKALGGETNSAIVNLVSIAEEQGEATIDNVNAFLSSRCNRIVGLISYINRTVANYKTRMMRNRDLSEGRALVGEQVLGLSQMLMDMASDLKNPIVFDTDKEKAIIDELACNSILCSDIVCGINGNGYSMTLHIQKSHIDNPSLLPIISKIMGFQVESRTCKPSDIDGFAYLTLADMPRFGACFAVSNHPYEGNTSGDSYSVCYEGNSKVMIALSDGMGTGALAHYNSSTTISMIESFYKSGLNNNAILSLVNKLLSTYNQESFTCLDMAMIDLNSGICDFIKLGAMPTFIIRSGECIKIEGGALPLGIVEEAEPFIDRKVLLGGDLLVNVSDGIVDSIGEDGVCLIATRVSQENPQEIADIMLEQSLKMGAPDDMTVIVTKIFIKHAVQGLANHD